MTPADLEIIRQLKAGRHGALYRLLFVGDWRARAACATAAITGPNQRLTQALLNLSAPGSPKAIPAGCMHSSRRAGLLRDKSQDHPTYLTRTIQKAIDGMGWQPAQASTGKEGNR